MSRFSNIFVDQGTSYVEVVDLKNDDGTLFDLTNFSVIAKAKKHAQSATSVVFATTIDIVASKITFSLTAAQTALLSPVNYLYDIRIINSVTAEVIKIVEGTMVVNSTVSL